MRAGTIVASNYLEMARLLAESFLAHHPDDSFVVLVVDDLPVGDLGGASEDDLAFDIVRLADLDLPPGDVDMMKTIYDVMELSTAVKPSFLRLLLREDDVAVYLDPDIYVYGAFDDLIAPGESGIVLTPHVLEPIPRDGTSPTERNIMGSGIFNLGFIGVSTNAAAMLDWWQERLLVDAVSDVEANLFTDQRWIDWVPALFGCHICRDPGMNIAWWNIHERDLQLVDGTDVGGGVTADAQPLRFVHFSGYDPAIPDRLSKHQGDPRTTHTEGTVIRALAEAYGDALQANGHDQRRHTPYEWNATVDGEDLPPFVRRTVRAALLSGERTGTEAGPLDLDVPFAFGPSAGGFEEWLAEDVTGTDAEPISRVELALYESRPDVQAAFPQIDGEHAAAFAAWLANDPGAREALGDRWRERPERATSGAAAAPRSSRSLARRVAGRAQRELAPYIQRARNKVGRR